MAQIGITQKETSTASQPAKVASQTKHQTQPASQPTSQPNKTNQPGNQIEKVMPKTWCLGGNDPNWNYFQRDWTLPCPKKKVIPKTNVSAKNDPNWYYSEGDIYSQPAKVASQTKHQTQPASQPTSQPNKTNQPGNQIQILSEKVMPKTWCSGGNDPNWYYFQREWTLPCPRK